MEKECFEFCAYYRKIAKIHKNWIFSQIKNSIISQTKCVPQSNHHLQQWRYTLEYALNDIWEVTITIENIDCHFGRKSGNEGSKSGNIF